MDMMIQRRLNPRNYLLELVLLALVIVFAITAPNFFTPDNMLNILRNIAFRGIVALGMTMVIISGEIDLSVGSGIAFYGVLTALVTKLMLAAGVNEYLAVAAAIAAALTAGAVVGISVATIITKFSVPSFITTLAMMLILRGVALIMSGGFPIITYPGWFSFFGSGYVGAVPFPVIIFTVILLIMFYIMHHTPFGRSIYAVGSNKESARLSGINVFGVKRTIFAVTSFFTALAGIMISSQINSGSPQSGQQWEIDVIASVIIGGAALSGGKGTIKGTLVGCIFLGVLLNGLTLLNVDEFWRHVVRGVLIFIAVLLNALIQKRV